MLEVQSSIEGGRKETVTNECLGGISAHLYVEFHSFHLISPISLEGLSKNCLLSSKGPELRGGWGHQVCISRYVTV